GVGHDDAGERLDGGALAGAVRADVADELAGFDRERDPVERAHGAVAAAREAAHGAPEAGPPLGDPVRLHQVLDDDLRHRYRHSQTSSITRWPASESSTSTSRAGLPRNRDTSSVTSRSVSPPGRSALAAATGLAPPYGFCCASTAHSSIRSCASVPPPR